MSNFSKIGFTSSFLTKKKVDQKNAILGPESQKMSFFEEVMIIFQKMWFDKKKIRPGVYNMYIQLGTYLHRVRGYYQQHSPQMGKIFFQTHQQWYFYIVCARNKFQLKNYTFHFFFFNLYIACNVLFFNFTIVKNKFIHKFRLLYSKLLIKNFINKISKKFTIS